MTKNEITGFIQCVYAYTCMYIFFIHVSMVSTLLVMTDHHKVWMRFVSF